MRTPQPGLPSAETRTRRRGQKRAGIAATDSETPASWGTKRARTRHPRRGPDPKCCCWAELSYGPAGLIAERALANGVEDYLSFRAVCREWRRSAKAIAVRAQGCLDRRFFPRRWIMLRNAVPPGSGSSRRRFLNVSTGECVHTELPELDDAQGHHHLLGATAEGLLALLDTSTYAVRLLNPLTRQLAELPSLYPLLPAKTLADIADDGLPRALEVRGLGLAAASDDATDDVALVICFIEPTMLVVAKPGDGSWTLVHGDERWFYSATSFAGRFYCADGRAVMALELPSTSDDQPPPRLVVVAKITIRVSHIGNDTVHLVKGGGADGEEELLLLYRGQKPQEDDPYARWRMKYVAFRVDLAARETVPVTGLGGLAVFLGEERALSVPHGVFPTISADTVCLGFDLFEREYEKLCAYCLLDGTTECCSFSCEDGWARPCGIVDYLAWYVSGTCEGIEEM